MSQPVKLPCSEVTAPRWGSLRLAAALVWLACCLLLVACGPPPFRFGVTFPGVAALESGAEVRYQGIVVGEVTEVVLRQTQPEQPAIVEVRCAISDPAITIRRSDWFEITKDGLMGASYLRITPSPEESPAIADGSVVAGTPPLVTRVRDSAEETLESLGSLARETAGEWLDALQDDDPDSDGESQAPTTP